jgi:hypothetical protein
MTSSSPLSLFTDRPSMHAAAPNGGGAVLLLLVGLLFASLWTLFDVISLATLLMAMCVGAVLRVWHDGHPATEYTRSRDDRFLLPQINISAVPVGADVGGLLFVGAALLTFIIGLPAMRTFAVASMLCSLISAAVLVYWRRAVTTPVTRLVS